MKKIGLCVIILCLLSGCNTWRGFGQDVQKAGEKIEKSGS
jgi:predicted small secreted protein